MKWESAPVDGVFGSAILQPSADHNQMAATGWFQIEIETARLGHIAGKEGGSDGANGRHISIKVHIEKSIIASYRSIIAISTAVFQCYSRNEKLA
jgi:hypothetical protein